MLGIILENLEKGKNNFYKHDAVFEFCCNIYEADNFFHHQTFPLQTNLSLWNSTWLHFYHLNYPSEWHQSQPYQDITSQASLDSL